MKTRTSLLFVLLAMAATPVLAVTATGSLNVTASVSATCIVGTSTTVAFGAYDPSAGSPKDAEGAVSVTCTDTTGYSVSLDAGAHETSPDDVTTRMMVGGSHGDLLPYQLYQDSGHTTVWGITTDEMGSLTGDGSAQSYTVYGRIPVGQYVQPDSYSDSVVVTVTY